MNKGVNPRETPMTGEQGETMTETKPDQAGEREAKKSGLDPLVIIIAIGAVLLLVWITNPYTHVFDAYFEDPGPHATENERLAHGLALRMAGGDRWYESKKLKPIKIFCLYGGIFLVGAGVIGVIARNVRRG